MAKLCWEKEGKSKRPQPPASQLSPQAEARAPQIPRWGCLSTHPPPCLLEDHRCALEPLVRSPQCQQHKLLQLHPVHQAYGLATKPWRGTNWHWSLLGESL